ncbi:MAG: DUF3226 domain-containing protein [Chloroflexota bacterium]
MTPIIRTRPKSILLVEGRDDKYFIENLYKKKSPSLSVNIELPKDIGAAANGVDALLEMFDIVIQADEYDVVGIVIDADEGNRWMQVRELVKASGIEYDCPVSPNPEGTIVEPPYEEVPKIGIWIMPDNKSPGILEDFVRYLIPDDDKLIPYAEKILDEIEAANCHRYRKHRSKAFIHTWLAWQKLPGTPMGQAITEKTLTADAQQAQIFMNWLQTLFSPT